jgi:hypothetical protein
MGFFDVVPVIDTWTNSPTVFISFLDIENGKSLRAGYQYFCDNMFGHRCTEIRFGTIHPDGFKLKSKGEPDGKIPELILCDFEEAVPFARHQTIW